MIHYRDDDVTVHHGDCLDVLAELPDASVDAVVTDPPYGISFMGKEWDGAAIRAAAARDRETRKSLGPESASRPGRSQARSKSAYGNEAIIAGPVRGRDFQDWCTAWSTECLRILKPGGHMVSFGGSRTWHRLAAGIEDSGFEIRDSIAWLYGSGLPKSLDVSKAIDRAAGAEREVIGEHPNPAGNKPGGASLNMSAVGMPDTTTVTAPATDAAKQWEGWGTALKPAFEPIVVARKPLAGTVAANVLEHGTGALNIDDCRVSTTDTLHGSSVPNDVRGGQNSAGRWPTNVVLDERLAADLDQQTGVLTSGTMRAGTERQPRTGGTIYGSDARTFTPADTYGDAGGASRFFPVFRYEAKAPTAERPTVDGTAHPTVKPLDLMRWLVRLVTPPNGLVLDPFAGSGTTAEACIHEHMRCITIEREADYLPLIVARLSKPMAVGFDFGDGS